jgi:hypothetical protein
VAKQANKRVREQHADAGLPLIEDIPLPPLDGGDPNAELNPRDYDKYGGALDRESAIANHFSEQKAKAHMRGDAPNLPWNVNGATKYERAVQLYGTQGDLKINITQMTVTGPMPRGMLSVSEVPSFGDFYNHVSEKWWDGNLADFEWQIMCGPRWVVSGTLHFNPDSMRRLEVEARINAWKSSINGKSRADIPEPPPQAAPPQQHQGGQSGGQPGGQPGGYPPGYMPPGYSPYGPQFPPPAPAAAVAATDPAIARELAELRRIVAEQAMREDMRREHSDRDALRGAVSPAAPPRGETPLPAPAVAPYVPVAPPVSQYPYPSAPGPVYPPAPAFGVGGFGPGGYPHQGQGFPHQGQGFPHPGQGFPQQGFPQGYPPQGYPPGYGPSQYHPFAPPPPPPPLPVAAPPPPPAPPEKPPVSPYDDPRVAMGPINQAVKLLEGVKDAAKYAGMVDRTELDAMKARMDAMQNGGAAAGAPGAALAVVDPNAPKMPHILPLGTSGASMVYDGDGNPLPPFNMTTVMANAPFLADLIGKGVGHFEKIMNTKLAAAEKAVELEERRARAIQAQQNPQRPALPEYQAPDPYAEGARNEQARQQAAYAAAMRAQEEQQRQQQQYAPPQQHYAPPQQHYAPPQQHYAPPEQQYAPQPQQHHAPPPQQRAYVPPPDESDPYAPAPVYAAAPAPPPAHHAPPPPPPPPSPPASEASDPYGSGQALSGQVDSPDDAGGLYDENRML